MTKETLGERISRIRSTIRMPNGKKMSQEDLEARSGVARRTIQNIEKDRGDVLLKNVIAIAKALNVSVDELVSDGKSEFSEVDRMDDLQSAVEVLEAFASTTPAIRAIALTILTGKMTYLDALPQKPEAVQALLKVLKRAQ